MACLSHTFFHAGKSPQFRKSLEVPGGDRRPRKAPDPSPEPTPPHALSLTETTPLQAAASRPLPGFIPGVAASGTPCALCPRLCPVAPSMGTTCVRRRRDLDADPDPRAVAPQSAGTSRVPLTACTPGIPAARHAEGELAQDGSARPPQLKSCHSARPRVGHMGGGHGDMPPLCHDPGQEGGPGSRTLQLSKCWAQVPTAGTSGGGGGGHGRAGVLLDLRFPGQGLWRGQGRKAGPPQLMVPDSHFPGC